MNKELLKGLNEEQIKKVKACTSAEELLELARAEGVELNEEQLDAVSGGGCLDNKVGDVVCVRCNSKNIKEIGKVEVDKNGNEVKEYVCMDCVQKFSIVTYKY